MSIKIDENKCVGCAKCVEVCPGNLIKLKNQNGRKTAFIKHERDCWGCTSCIKECSKNAIIFFLASDIGGKGSTMSVHLEGDVNIWTITKPSGEKVSVNVNRKESNKY